MGPYKYKVLKIEGEYVTLLRTDTDTNDTMFIAMALLPDRSEERKYYSRFYINSIYIYTAYCQIRENV